jgi:hypothetical protein
VLDLSPPLFLVVGVLLLHYLLFHGRLLLPTFVPLPVIYCPVVGLVLLFGRLFPTSSVSSSVADPVSRSWRC